MELLKPLHGACRRVLEEYHNLALSLRFTPHISPAVSGAEALSLLEKEDRNFQVVAASPRLVDIVVISPIQMDRSAIPQVAAAVEKINRTIADAGREYVL